LAGISSGLPEWQRARKLQERAASVGFDWPEPE
jgi:nucleoside triphosphate diphosphatase